MKQLKEYRKIRQKRLIKTAININIKSKNKSTKSKK